MADDMADDLADDLADDVTDGTPDDADLGWIADELAGLTWLTPTDQPADQPAEEPADEPADEPMPAWVWVRLQGAFAAEQTAAGQTAAGQTAAGQSSAASPVADGAEVIDLSSRRPGRATRWAGGLVAASVAVLAVGVGVTAFRGDGGSTAVVAGEMAQASALSAPTEARAFGASPAPSAAAADAQLLEGPESLSFAGFSPAKMMVASDTDYTADGLRGQVRSVLSKFGIADTQQAETVMAGPAEMEPSAMPGPGFLSSEESLRDCIDKLTEDAGGPALLVDNSTYEGQEAGVVVAPEDMAREDMASEDTATEVSTPAVSVPDMSTLAVWVVDEDCDILVKGITLRLTP